MAKTSPTNGHPREAANDEKTVTFRGRPVPWITRWTGEILSPDRVALQTPRNTAPLRYAEATLLDRDRRGVLWLREANTPGTGEPQWAEVNGPRQRRAMRALRCQVCGEPTSPGMPVPFLFSRTELAALRHAQAQATPAVTTTPPCCQACWQTAAQFCPHLIRHGAVPCHVTTVTAWGAYGDLYLPGASVRRNIHLGYGDERLPWLLGKQAVVLIQGIQPAG
ncbi:hypothetical protein [Phytohabitans kaempferiae]|uniref:Uncharacterized protein n=1 Tax=Phytohabitans kaempferiae TaxID=1620943 RepID=A0ABV6M9V1_9ACTN